VPTSATVNASFSEPVQGDTISFSLTGPNDSAVSASTAYDSATRTAKLTPSARLSPATTYTARVSGAKDSAGNTMAAESWSFTTAADGQPPPCPCSLWPSTAIPRQAADPDTSPVQVGVKFRSDVAGQIRGIRFYKSSANTGAHVGSLWSASGNRLASASFTNETASGWQEVSLATPVQIQAGTTYVASYHAPNGRYAADEGFFSGAGVDAPPLHALRDGVAGGDGVYSYGSANVFPSSTYRATNYWVDVVFVPSSP
jgi:Domain of unknown function (DUF4082)/Bacterial Ig-like domain